MRIIMSRKQLNKLLKQYYQIKKKYDYAIKEYANCKATVRYWFGFDNQTKPGKALHLYSHFKREGKFTWLETRECAREYERDLYTDRTKEEVKEGRRISTENCAECKKKVKDLNNQLQIIHDMLFNHITTNLLLERYAELEEQFIKDKKKLEGK